MLRRYLSLNPLYVRVDVLYFFLQLDLALPYRTMAQQRNSVVSDDIKGSRKQKLIDGHPRIRHVLRIIPQQFIPLLLLWIVFLSAFFHALFAVWCMGNVLFYKVICHLYGQWAFQRFLQLSWHIFSTLDDIVNLIHLSAERFHFPILRFHRFIKSDMKSFAMLF